MQNRVVTRLAGILAVLGTCFTGCDSCKPGKPGPIARYTVEVSLDESLKNSGIVVDLVAVNPSTLPRWESYDMEKYWKDPHDVMRTDADKAVLNFVSGQVLTNSLAATDPHWDRWLGKGATHLMVLADLPGAQASRQGNQDPRRQILSLDKCNWPGKTTTLKVLVQRSGPTVLTPTRLAK